MYTADSNRWPRMQLLRPEEVEIGIDDRVFRHARLRALILWLAGIAATAGLLIHGYLRRSPPDYFFGALLLVFVLTMRGFVTARFHPSNWLVRLSMTGIYVQYRSYLNYGLARDTPSIVFLSFGEIVSARLIKERLDTPDLAKPGTTQRQYLRHIELELSNDAAPLAHALEAERAERPPLVKHWYGTSSTLYRDYPVTMPTQRSIRIHWDVVPGTHKFLEAMRSNTLIADPVSLTQDFGHMKSLSREDQQQKLRDLIARGQNMTAVYAASKLYDCSLGQAKALVDSLCQSVPASASLGPSQPTPPASR